MLGDSITARLAYSQLADRTDIAIYSVGYTAEDCFNALPIVYGLNPEICFIGVGINDLYYRIPVQIIVDKMNKIIDGLEENGIRPIIQSLIYFLPRNPSYEMYYKVLDELNYEYRNLCHERNIEFINLNSVLSENGVLKEEYKDYGYLNSLGMDEWIKLLLSIIDAD